MEITEMEEVKKSTVDQGDVILPGFRFHPTDEELVGFYLRRKVEKKPIIIELIKQIDIYKYDPWDLPKVGSSAGEKEWYFFCLRGRKYRNSIRPNRVARSGFWKATGIDRPIYPLGAGKSTQLNCIGLKKSLVYYRGSAGKGTKTDWMMHEFRLPPATKDTSTTTLFLPKNAQEAEIWTICRIFWRTGSNRKFTPPATLMTTFPSDTYSFKQLKQAADKTPKDSIQNGSGTVCKYDQRETSYNSVLAGASAKNKYPVKKQQVVPQVLNHIITGWPAGHETWRPIIQPAPPSTSAPYSSFSSSSDNTTTERACKYGDWDELGVVVDCAMDPDLLYIKDLMQ